MKKIIKIKYLLTIALILLGSFFYYREASALVTITMSPMSQKIILIPGEKYEGSLTIANPANSTEDLQYKASIGAYSIHSNEYSKDDYGDMNYEEESNYNIMMKWLTIENPIGSIEPGGETKILFTIDVPEDAPAGGQYASILVAEDKQRDTLENSVGIVEIIRMAHVIYAEVAGETRQEGAILENSMPSFLLSSPLEATSMVRNNGNVHTDASYILQLWPLFSDEEICTNEEEPETSLVLPDTERYHAQSCNLPSMGIFRAKQIVKIFGEESIVEKTIIVCPIWLLFIIIFIIFALIFYLIAKAKSRKKASRKASKTAQAN